VKKFITIFVLLFIIYLLYIQTLVIQEIIAGLFGSLIISFIVVNYFKFDLFSGNFIVKIVKFFILYVPKLLIEIVKANIHMAMIVLSPKIKIKSGFVKQNTSLGGDISRLMLANSITLTPGTLTVDVDEEKGEYIIHTVEKDKVKGNEIVEHFEKTIKEVFE